MKPAKKWWNRPPEALDRAEGPQCVQGRHRPLDEDRADEGVEFARQRDDRRGQGDPGEVGGGPGAGGGPVGVGALEGEHDLERRGVGGQRQAGGVQLAPPVGGARLGDEQRQELDGVREAGVGAGDP